jgi:hypothetical protein
MSISLEQLKEAVAIKEQIAKLEAQLNRILGGKTPAAPKAPAAAPTVRAKKGPSKMSSEAKAKISAAAKERWAKIKGVKAASNAAPAPKAPKKAKRVLSPEGKANIIAAAKKRWAAKRS